MAANGKFEIHGADGTVHANSYIYQTLRDNDYGPASWLHKLKHLWKIVVVKRAISSSPIVYKDIRYSVKAKHIGGKHDTLISIVAECGRYKTEGNFVYWSREISQRELNSSIDWVLSVINHGIASNYYGDNHYSYTDRERKAAIMSEIVKGKTWIQ